MKIDILNTDTGFPPSVLHANGISKIPGTLIKLKLNFFFFNKFFDEKTSFLLILS